MIRDLTLGAEEEYLVVDRETRELVPRCDELLPAAVDQMDGRVEHELNLCQVEVATKVCQSSRDIETELSKLRRSLDLVAQPLGLGVIALGSHPFSTWRSQAIDRGIERYHHIDDVYRLVAREQVICGCHVHVGVDDPDLAIATMTRIRSWLGPLLALAANSPFWSGVDTGYDSYRTQVWARWPTSGMPPALPDHGAYVELVGRLEDSGAFDDPSFLYWHVRPSQRYPTLEFRIFDVCMSPEETATIAALTRALVATELAAVEQGSAFDDVPRDVLDAACWRASRYGLHGELVSPRTWTPAPAPDVVNEFVAHVREALDVHGDAEMVARTVSRVLTTGNGATRQRRAYEQSESAADVVDLALLATADCIG